MKQPYLQLTFLAASALLAASFNCPAADAPPAAKQAGKGPVKVFVLAGQSNMEGPAVVDIGGKDCNDGHGNLETLMKDPAKAPMLKHLRGADGKWTVRDDVWVRYQRENAPLLAGPHGLGFSVFGEQHHFGPELQFGHVIGDAVDNQVLLVKTAWGGKSLDVDFRPPSSGGQVGKYYTMMIAQIHDAMNNLKKDFPAYDGRGVELAGFVWWHGWNDMCDAIKATPAYEQNLVHLIHDVRKEFNVPKLPFVIGEFTGPWLPGAKDLPAQAVTIRKAQETVAAMPEFKGTVVFVPTRDFVRKPEDSPNPTHGHHEFGNAETYFLVGDAMAKGMAGLLKK
ncbi:MAG: sialate O-acetylesterase [Verrucomicrobiota bacterium]